MRAVTPREESRKTKLWKALAQPFFKKKRGTYGDDVDEPKDKDHDT
jgi:hypothetical protein